MKPHAQPRGGWWCASESLGDGYKWLIFFFSVCVSLNGNSSTLKEGNMVPELYLGLSLPFLWFDQLKALYVACGRNKRTQPGGQMNKYGKKEEWGLKSEE